MQFQFAQEGVDLVPNGAGLEGGGGAGHGLSLRVVGGEPSFVSAPNAARAPISRFAGPDASTGRQDANSASRLVYPQVYEGIDLTFLASPDGLKYEFEVGPNADASLVALAFPGAFLALKADGDLDLAVGDVHLTDARPYAIQDGRTSACIWVLRTASSAAIDCPHVRPGRPALIDPLVSATYLGGPANDHPEDVAVGADGSVFVVGWTEGGMEISPGAFNATHEGIGFDAFIAKYDANLSTLVYATYVGGASGGFEMFTAVAVDAMGRAYVTGRTEQASYPTTSNKLQACSCGFNDGDAVITVFNADGSALLFSTTFGGNGSEQGTSIEVDGAFNVLVAGYTQSVDFPTTPGAYDNFVGAPGPTPAADGWIARVDPWNGTLLASTVLGGSAPETVNAARFSASGTVFAVGTTIYFDFAATAGAYDVPFNYLGGFVLEMTANLTTMVYHATIGEATPTAVAAITDGSVVVAGTTTSGVNGTAGAADPSPDGAEDAFVLRLQPGGGNASFVTYLGGAQRDTADDLAVDAAGGIFVTGITGSSDFPTTTGAPNETIGGGADAYLVKLAPAGERIAYSTYVGGVNDDSGLGLDVGADGTACMAAETRSPGLVTIPGAHDSTNNSTDGSSDILAACYWFDDAPTAALTVAPSTDGFLGTQFVFSAEGSSDGDGSLLLFDWSVDGSPAGGGATAIATFASKGTHVVSVVVSDPFGASDRKATNITIVNRPPVAAAGADTLEGRGSTVILDATASSDPDGDPLSFLWSQTSGPSVVLAPPDNGTAVVVLPTLANYTFCVVVSDPDGGSATACRIIEVANRPPMAVISLPATPPKGSTIVLDGGASLDPDNDTLGYAWTQAGGLQLLIANGTTASASVALAHGGDFIFCLEVSDGHGLNATACGNVSVVNRPPAIGSFGPPTDNIEMQASVPTDYSVTATDADGDALAYQWSLDGTATGGNVATLPVQFQDAGIHVITVYVSDGDASTLHSWHVLVKAAPPKGFLPGPGALEVALLISSAAALLRSRRREQ